jgi:glycyl-tRNA synthetase beta chain
MEQRYDLLVEIGTEELPPTALRRLSEAFAEQLSRQFDEHGLTHDEVTPFATPRRLALQVSALASRQPDQENLRRGPAVAAAFTDNGSATQAALGFARSCGVDVSELRREESDKGAWLAYLQRIEGQATDVLLPQLISNALAQLPIPKRMRWGNGSEEFVRPVHWVCVLFGPGRVSGNVLGTEIVATSRGHRFHHPDTVPIARPSDYADALRAAYVEPSLAVRRQRISEQARQLAAKVGGTASIPDALLDEVAALCEWPVALLGRFEPEFLQVPADALVETMQKNQKYFPVLGDDGALMPYFVAVSNIESRDPALVQAGNERVIRPRFADAKFFWEQDRKVRLEDRRESLKPIVFQHRLGSVWDKSLRVAALSRHIARLLDYDPDLAERAAVLGKCDLVTLMVGEFGSLQGIMGRYYAQHSGEPPCVVAAMEEQYLPRHAGDSLPESECGRVLALADKLDTLIGIFAIGEKPTGVKDPYGLRRAAIGVLRMLIEIPLALDLKALLSAAAEGFPGEIPAKASVDEVFDYINDRLRGYYGERAIGMDIVDAVLAVSPTVPSDVDRRVLAVAEFRRLDAAEALAAANKRIRNILKKSAAGEIGDLVDPDLLVEPAEQRLAERIVEMRSKVEPLLFAQDYESALRTLAELRPDVDRFFDQVMVMAEDSSLRANRLAILRELEQLFLATADIARLQ